MTESTTDQKKILVIENQYYQHAEIATLLRPSFDVFPYTDRLRGPSADASNSSLRIDRVEQFTELIDPVRIYLNERFFKPKRGRAAGRIKRLIDKNLPDIFVVDQVLVGHHKGKKGTDLAAQILSKYDKPILFISRSDMFLESTQNTLAKLRQAGVLCNWVNKGYSGLSILQEDYFRDCVQTSIHDLLDEHERRNTIRSILANPSAVLSDPASAVHAKLVNILRHYIGDTRDFRPNLSTATGVLDLLDRMIESFRDAVERIGYKKFLHLSYASNSVYAHEDVSHLLFQGIANLYQELFGINLAYELRMDNARADFALMGDKGCRIVVEFKLDRKPSEVIHGIEVQFKNYLDQFGAKGGTFVLMQVKNVKNGERKIAKFRSRWIDLYGSTEENKRFRIIDGRERQTPSKRKEAL